MTPKILISSLVVSSLLFVSCKKELEPQESTPTSELVKLGLAKDTTKVNTPVAPAQTMNPNTVLSSNHGINPAHGQPGHRCDIAVGAPLNSAPTQTTNGQAVQTQNQQVVTTTTMPSAPVKVAKGMNPSHGQPGHRCDIPVGAPLNSPVAKTTATTPQVVTTTSTAAPVKVAKGMNPSHGQPGHRCDIPVGAPLNSPVTKPAAALSESGTSTQTFTVTPPPATNATPALLSTEPETKVADGMNPLHGKPGHRCDIPVGSPLPKS